MSGPAWTLGEDSGSYPLPDLAAFSDALLHLLPQTRRSVIIQAPELDTPWLGDQAIGNLLGRHLRHHPRFRLQLLFNDARRAVRQGHHLIRLAQQFPSYFDLRRAQPDDQRNAAWLILDERALISRDDAQRFRDGTACPNAPLAARNLLRDFEDRWQRAQPDPQLRRLYL